MDILNNILELSNPKLEIKSLIVCGVKIGDSSENIPTEIITEGPHRGWFHTNKGVTIRTTDEESPIVIEFLFKPESLEELRLKTKRKIVKRFGKPEAEEQKSGTTYYFYSSRKIVIAWNNESDRVSGLYIGQNIIKQTEYTIKDFLDKFHEFKAMVPDYNEWNLRSLKHNEPRFYRLKELESLMIAFEIGTDLFRDYQNRSFLERRNLSDFDPIIKDIEKYALADDFEKARYKPELERIQNTRSFEMLIQSFMRFSEEMHNLLRFNSGYLEAGFVMSRYSINKTQKLLNAIDLSELNEIENLLCRILDPKNKIFTKNQLINNYNFPNVDLHSIDMDNY